MYILDHILLSSSNNKKMFQTKVAEKMKTQLFMLSNFLSKIVPFVRECGKML